MAKSVICKAYLTTDGMRCDRCRFLISENEEAPRCLREDELGKGDPLVPFFRAAFAAMQAKQR